MAMRRCEAESMTDRCKVLRPLLRHQYSPQARGGDDAPWTRAMCVGMRAQAHGGTCCGRHVDVQMHAGMHAWTFSRRCESMKRT